MIKLNIGCGPNPRGEYINLDGLEWDGKIDGLCDLGRTPYEIFIHEDKLPLFKDSIDSYTNPAGLLAYKFKSNVVEHIMSIEFLEHISFKETINVLEEWNRILSPGGSILLQVPDCGKAMEYYVNNEICDCVPPKGEKQVADEKCFVCDGKAKINPMRWLLSFTGAQKHQYDAHLNIFTKDRMELALKKAMFSNIRFEEDPFKLKVKAEK